MVNVAPVIGMDIRHYRLGSPDAPSIPAGRRPATGDELLPLMMASPWWLRPLPQPSARLASPRAGRISDAFPHLPQVPRTM